MSSLSPFRSYSQVLAGVCLAYAGGRGRSLAGANWATWLAAIAAVTIAGCSGSDVDLGSSQAPGADVSLASDVTQTGAPPTICLADSDCADLANDASSVCLRAVCEPTTRHCLVVIKPDGAACEDGDPCSSEALCAGGKCSASRATNCDDANPCTADSCAVGLGCQHTATEAACSDGNPCSVGDRCEAGACVAVTNACACKNDADCKAYSSDLCSGALVCSAGLCAADPAKKVDCDDKNPCTTDVCDPKTGECGHPLVGDGTPCDDGDVCTFGEFCQGAQCKAASNVACGVAPGSCAVSCDSKLGCTAPAGGSQPCDDGFACSKDDLCSQGSCVGAPSCACKVDSDCADAAVPACAGVPVCQGGLCVVDPKQASQCPAAGPCQASVCTATGCLAVQLPDGASCTDGDACTFGDVCAAGACKGGQAFNCDDGEACTADSCDVALGCAHTPTGDETACDDGNPCSTDDACKSGQCAGQGDLCNDGDPCTDDLCDPTVAPASPQKSCKYLLVKDGTACDDDNPCASAGACTGGVCVPAQILDCNDGSPCTTDSCKDGACVHAPLASDVTVACDDGDVCTSDDACDAGTCKGKAGACQCQIDSDCATFEDGNACNGTLRCVASACVVDPGTVVTCPVSANPCSNFQCQPAIGVCIEVPVPTDVTATTCDDGNACTLGDACGPGGACLGGNAIACDDGNVCTLDTCDPATGCAYLPLDATAAAPCDDGNPCTFGDLCASGVCNPGKNACACQIDADCAANDDADLCNGSLICQQGACVSDGKAVVCAAGNNPCVQSQCDSKTGQCVSFAQSDGLACSPQGLCTTGSTCKSGVCSGATVAGCDDGNPCTIDSCDASGCVHTPSVGATCDDANPCTTGEVCGATATCGGGTNTCTCQIDSDCAKLDDGDLCNGVWSCSGGTCQPKTGSQVVCDASQDGPCAQNLCDAKTGACALTLQPTGTACSDGDACTSGDTCAAGKCAPGLQNNCDDGDACTTDGCNPATGCYANVTNAACDDGNPCTQNDNCATGKCVGVGECACQIDADCKDDGNLCNGLVQCIAGQCAVAPGSAVTCDPAVGGVCGVNACDPATGQCTLTAVPDGTLCDDASVCTTKDQCVGGSCKGTLFACDDNNPCSTDTCDPTKGCVNAPVADKTSCDDGDACTTADACTSGKCLGGNNICGACQTDAQCPNDGDACNGVITCQAGQCATKAGSVVTCSGGSTCAPNSCDKATGQCIATTLQDGSACDDGTVCTAASACVAGQCVGSSPLNCDDNNPCTLDNCDATAGCQNTAAPGPCDDGNACTSGDTCTEPGICKPGANTCQCQTDGDCAKVTGQNPCDGTLICQANQCVVKPGTAVVCTASGPCVTAACDPATAQCVTQNAVDGAVCDDGSSCTTGEVCKGGFCVGQALACDDKNPCTADLCDAAKGCSYVNQDGVACDDGNPCTTQDLCSAGACKAGANTCQCATTNDCAKFEDGNLCNGTLSCQAGTCVVNPATVVTCAASSDACGVATCDAASGKCVNQPAADGTACGGSALCGGIGVCKAGVCAGNSGCPDDGNACTTATCDGKGGCAQSPTAGTCSDGNPCTVGDTCSAGQCVGGSNQCNCQIDSDCNKFDDGDLCNGVQKCVAGSCQFDAASVVICPAVAGACSSNVCQPTTGACKQTSAANGTPCDDTDACTAPGQCFGGACLVTQISCDDKNPCTSETCDSKLGCQYKNLGGFPPVTCDDGDVCTLASICQNGKCTGVFNNCFCQNDTQCKDDGNLCNGIPSCQNGTCKTKPGSVVTCDTAQDTACLANTCVSATGTCVLQPKAAGSTCNDGNTCTGGDVCSAGTCIGVPANCDDGVACTADACDAKAGCTHVAQNKLCDDGNLCTTDTCNAVSGCLTQIALGVACDDGNGCTSGDACTVAGGGAVCIGAGKTVCDDKNACTSDACDPKVGCVFTASSGATCDDGDACTSGDVCSAGVCKGAAASCDDKNPCTTDSCVAGKCTNAATTGACSDGSVCTTGDSCIAGQCIGAGKVNCDDANPCTSDACDPTQGCKNTPNFFAVCDDGSPCTLADACSNGKCVGSIKSCTDGNVCTQDACDSQTGNCLFVPVAGGTCDDGSACTSGDVCGATGACKGVGSVNCDDGNACTDDACVAATGTCTSTNNTAACSDGQPCTAEACSGGSCVAKAAPGLACSDGDLCTINDVCLGDGKTCQGTVNSCDDGVACTTDACNAATGACTHTAPAGFTKNFDDGTIAPIATQSLNPQLSWQLDKSQVFTAPNALYYGRIQNGVYSYDAGPGGGQATLPAIAVPTTVTAPKLTLKMFFDKDQDEAASCAGFADQVRVTVNGQQALQLCANTLIYKQYTIDLTAYKGQTVNIAIVFVANLTNNKGKGLFVDDIAVSWNCP